MGNSKSQLPREDHDEVRKTEYERKRKERMDSEQTQQRLLQRRENYKRRKNKGNEVEISCTNDIVEPNVTNQIFTAMNFSNAHFQGTHDNEAESSTIHINDPTLG
jgi:hypothetical protein